MKKTLLLMLSCFGTLLFAQVSPLPIKSFDYFLPENNVSPIAIGMGAMNITNPQDPFASYSNPALLAQNQNTHVYFSYRLANSEKLSFWEAVNISNALKEKQFKYFTACAGKMAFSYQPMASVNISKIDLAESKSLYYDYKLDKLQASFGISDANWPNIALGLNLKYLSGRVVFLEEQINGFTFNRLHFIDDKVKGFSTDLSFLYAKNDLSLGVVAYDLLSGMYWENYPTKELKRRFATGVQYGAESSRITIGLQSNIAKKADTSYHLAYQTGFGFGAQDYLSGGSTNQGIDLRIGTYSHDFYGADNINFTLGGGYHYQLFRFDVSLNSRGLKIADSELLFSLGMGF